MAKEVKVNYLSEGLCPYCPWIKYEVDKLHIGGCDGVYCSKLLEAYVEEGLI